ncbi:MAG: pyridoxamine 5'-phosphate oxidase family protein [Propionibacteriaceae bacterium]|nr:pyridoxamine 5'-phosphate oxidase family protein [Propionibacteriaceae bacterium]
MTATSEEVEKVSKLIEGARIALVTTVGPEGQLFSRPLAMPDREFDGELWFFTQDPSSKTEQVAANDQVNVALQVDNGYVSIAGTATVSRDQAMIDELWNRHAAAWFEEGREDPAVALLRVKADSAEYWTVDSPKLVAAIKYAKAIVTGGQPDVGDNVSVNL